MEQLERIERVGIKALIEAYKRHESLDVKGLETINKNQFGDTALRGDIEAERAVLTSLKESGFAAVVRSEEHGETETGRNPQYFGVLDGIDGSAWYVKSRGEGRYGTLFGLYAGTDPQYGDYIFSGIMEHATKRLFYAVKGMGSFVLYVETGEKRQIKTSGISVLDPTTVLRVDEYWPVNQEVFMSRLDGFLKIGAYELCSSVGYADVVSGITDLALECTRKGNLEIAAVYGLITEAGGQMVTLDGGDLRDRKYKEFGQTEHIPVIAAASPDLARNAAQFFSTHPH